MILAGVILAEAAAVHDGLNAVQTQSYGPEARGGASRSEVIIAHGEIDYPKVMDADLLLCMSQEACDKFYDPGEGRWLIVVDSTTSAACPAIGRLPCPLHAIAEEATGRRITASIVALGLVGGLTGMVGREALESAVRRTGAGRHRGDEPQGAGRRLCRGETDPGRGQDAQPGIGLSRSGSRKRDL